MDTRGGRLDSSFQSFINTTNETLGGEEQTFEVLFHNEALLKILGEKSDADLETIVNKALFKNKQLRDALSLCTAAQDRYSDDLLKQSFSVVNFAKNKAARKKKER